jgi:UDPglucose 6-dehydrogenase
MKLSMTNVLDLSTQELYEGSSVATSSPAPWKNPNAQKIAVVGGAGFVGLTKAVVDSMDFGHDVTAIDINKNAVQRLSGGQLINYIPGLQPLLEESLAAGQLRFTDNLAEGIKDREIIFVALPTPQSETGEADVSYLEKAVGDIAGLLKAGESKIIVGKSTAPPETINSLRKITDKKLKNGAAIRFAWEPEFLREGKELPDARGEAGRIVIGAEDPAVSKRIADLYNDWDPDCSRKKVPVVIMDIRSAMLVKYAANGFRALKISFANFVAGVAEELGFYVGDLLKKIEHDDHGRNFGKGFLNAGLGFGGSCFPKDLAAFICMAKEAAGLLKNVQEINEFQWQRFVEQIKKEVGPFHVKKTIAILGASFKPDTSDVRKACSIKIIEALSKSGCNIRVFDPVAIPFLKKELPNDTNVEYFQIFKEKDSLLVKQFTGDNREGRWEEKKSFYETMADIDGMALVTEWDIFKDINFERISQQEKRSNGYILSVFDGRNHFKGEKEEEIQKVQFKYFGIGRGDLLRESAVGMNGGPTQKELSKEFLQEWVKSSYLALRIAFANMIAEISDHAGANVYRVLEGLRYDPVVGSDYLSPSYQRERVSCSPKC